MKPNEILQELRRLVDHLEIVVTPLLLDSGFKSKAELDEIIRQSPALW